MSLLLLFQGFGTFPAPTPPAPEGFPFPLTAVVAAMGQGTGIADPTGVETDIGGTPAVRGGIYRGG